MNKILVLAAVLLAAGGASAHEGHDKAPGAVSAPHGGLVSGASHIQLELLPTADGVQIYPYDAEMNLIPLDKVSLEGKVAFPRNRKTETVKFAKEGETFAAKIDAKGANRYTLEVSVTHGGKKEQVKFNVEPR